MLSCEFCEISKNTFIIEHLWATTSEMSIFMGKLSMIMVEYFKELNLEQRVTAF